MDAQVLARGVDREPKLAIGDIQAQQPGHHALRVCTRTQPGQQVLLRAQAIAQLLRCARHGEQLLRLQWLLGQQLRLARTRARVRAANSGHRSDNAQHDYSVHRFTWSARSSHSRRTPASQAL
jgi:hypothetical protein